MQFIFVIKIKIDILVFLLSQLFSVASRIFFVFAAFPILLLLLLLVVVVIIVVVIVIAVVVVVVVFCCCCLRILILNEIRRPEKF